MKLFVLYVLRGLGFVALGRRLFANKTLILAYHGFALLDARIVDPLLFISGKTLQKRLNYLKKHCAIITLDDLGKNRPDKNKVIVTVDDGWSSTLSVAAPILKSNEIPYTVYLTTENVLDNQPIFHHGLKYILMHCLGKRLILEGGDRAHLDFVISADNIDEIGAAVRPLKREKNDTSLLREIAKSLQFDFTSMIENRALTLMSVDEVKRIRDLGADIQLHTHTHDTPLYSYDLFAEEININRELITNIFGKPPTHHCYPSSVYNASSFSYLRRLGIETASTCYPGLCDEDTNSMELPRFLDSEDIPQIIFEAEVSGISESLRRFRKWYTGLFRPSNLATALQ